MDKKLPTTLPKFLHRYFWDTDASKVNPANSRRYIIERLMNWGDFDVFRWLIDNFPRELLKDVALHGRDIAKRNRPLWLNYLKAVPVEKLCSQKELLQTPGVAWPY